MEVFQTLVTMEKVIDGYPLFITWQQLEILEKLSRTLVVFPSKKRCDVRLGIYEEEKGNNVLRRHPGIELLDRVSLRSLSFWNVLESVLLAFLSMVQLLKVSLVGNNKQWL